MYRVSGKYWLSMCVQQQQAEWLPVSRDKKALPQDCTLRLLTHMTSPENGTGP